MGIQRQPLPRRKALRRDSEAHRDPLVMPEYGQLSNPYFPVGYVWGRSVDQPEDFSPPLLLGSVTERKASAAVFGERFKDWPRGRFPGKDLQKSQKPEEDVRIIMKNVCIYITLDKYKTIRNQIALGHFGRSSPLLTDWPGSCACSWRKKNIICATWVTQ